MEIDMNTSKIPQALAAFVLISLSSTAAAVCIQTGASQADRDLWAIHGCWQEYYQWQYQAYNMSGDDWGDRGWNDACNQNLEYPKHWNASYLVSYGLQDNNNQSFHGTVDYKATAEKYSTDYHGYLEHLATDDLTIFGSYSEGVFTDTLRTSCLLYNPAVANANPASRAGDFMHEAWHGWMIENWYSNGNVAGHRATQGNCTVNGCDYFYFHGIAQYVFGAMWQSDGTANRFHSPNQVQVEFLCDVADQPQNWVPNSVRLAAQADANTRAVQRFINGPGYRCGDPRPW
jgi:hypothetical protein